MSLENKKNILFISISADMYGSSKLLLALVVHLKNTSVYNPIVCVPYEEGPLKEKLKEEGIETIETPVLKLTRSMLKSLRFGKFYKEYKKAKKIIEDTLGDREIISIQSNTVATLFGSIYCLNKKIYHIIHVHEIMDRPHYVRYFFSSIQLFFADKVIYNSTATETFYYNTINRLKKKGVMIFNGVERESDFLSVEERDAIRKKVLKANDNEILIGLIGRFNRLKGHKLLIDAYKEIVVKHKNTKLCLIGSPPDGQEFFLEDVKQKIIDDGLTANVKIFPFQDNIYEIIDALDIVVVPSTEPESFGIIAVEGMLSKKPVIASDLGGLSNIIDHGETGILFESGNKGMLVESLQSIIENPSLKNKLEENGYKKAVESFSVEAMTKSFLKVYEKI